jgi:hypothetical protein
LTLKEAPGVQQRSQLIASAMHFRHPSPIVPALRRGTDVALSGNECGKTVTTEIERRPRSAAPTNEHGAMGSLVRDDGGRGGRRRMR